MNVYTRAALMRLLGLEAGADVRPLLKQTRRATMQSPTMHELLQPVDVGERRPAKVIAEVGKGFILTPTLASARTAYATREHWVPQIVDAAREAAV